MLSCSLCGVGGCHDATAKPPISPDASRHVPLCNDAGGRECRLSKRKSLTKGGVRPKAEEEVEVRER